MIVFLSTCVVADLSEFPGNFLKDGEFDGFIVVGKEASSTDVISQSAIALKLGQVVTKPKFDINKLDDEVELENNIILVGNPCVNKLTSALLDNPSPCDKDFHSGKAFIKYLEKDGYKYIVVAGNTDKETREAAQYLANYDTYGLSGSEIEISLVSDEEFEEIIHEQQETNEAEPEQAEQPELETPKPELYEDETENQEEQGAQQLEEESGPSIVEEEEKGIFTNLWDWFISLFKS